MSPWEAQGEASGGTPSISSRLPRPSFWRFGTSRPPTARAVLARVLAPSSPNSAASGAWPAPTPSRTTTMALRPMTLLSPDQHTRDGGVQQVCQRTGDEGPDAELRDLVPSARRHPSYAADQDGYRADVREPGEGEGDDGYGLLRELD